MKWESDKKWQKVIKSTQRGDVLTLNGLRQLWSLGPVCSWHVPKSCDYTTPGRAAESKIDNWESLADWWNQWLTGDWVSSLHIVTNSNTSESILQTCNITQSYNTTNYIYSFKDFRLVDLSEVAKIYIICARVSVIFLLGTYNICTVLIQYHIVRTAILLAEICNLHIYYIFLTSIYSFKYHIRVQGAKIS